jgi:hypothetical protein
MPKITNRDYIIAGVKYPCSVWYTASNKFFLKGFPLAIERTAQITPLGSKTEDELYQRYEDGIKRYEVLIATSKKVIVFRLRAAKPHLENRYSEHRDSLPQMPVGVSSSHMSDMGFEIDYEVKMLRSVDKARYLHNIDNDGKPYGSGDPIMNDRFSKIIDYTPEREQAFKELYVRFDNLLMAFINGFFEAEKFIDSIPTTKLLK